jgi:hypothetical protein
VGGIKFNTGTSPSACIHSLSVMHITVVECHTDPVILISDWKPGTGEIIPLLFLNDPKVPFRFTNHRQLKYQSAFDKPIELHWSTCGDKIQIQLGLEPRSLAEHPN